MESRKCPNCGGGMELSRSKNMLECPYCGSKFEIEAKDKEKIAKKRNSLDEEIFCIERDFSGEMQKKQTGKCINTIIYCMNELGTSEKVEEHILKGLISGDCIASENKNTNLINAVRGRINAELTADERIIVYSDQGIFSKGKEYTVVTNKRFLFFTKKKCSQVSFDDISTLRLSDSADFAAWYINGGFDTRIPSMEPSGQLTGAVIAFACLSAFEKQPDRSRIRLI